MDAPNKGKKIQRDLFMVEQQKKRNQNVVTQIEEMKKDQEISIKTGLHNRFYNDGFVNRQMEFLNNMQSSQNQYSVKPTDKEPVAIYYSGRK
jgi:hypothetical protein